MKRIDCGTSGLATVVGEVGWRDLRMGGLWEDVLKVMSPGRLPRPAQYSALGDYRVLENRRNLIISAPTNGGKTLVGLLVLLEAVRRGGRAVLLEPLRAIARERAEELREVAPRLEPIFGRPVRVRVSTGDHRLEHETFFDAPSDEGEIIVATPERFEAILRNPDHDGWVASIEAVCVDEAHLIGSPHRGPTLEYLITRLLCLPAPPRLVLLSATLGDLERACSWLSPCDAITVKERYPPLRKEVLELDLEQDANKTVVSLAEEALADPDASVLIFTYQTRSTELLAGLLAKSLGDRAGASGPLAYHARMGLAQRESVRESFRSGRCRCVVATTALGLGVNLPATHVIIRDATFGGVGPVGSEDLLQMMGRAGRGNRTGHAVVIVRPNEARSATDVARALREEELPALVSHFDKTLGHARTWGAASETDAELVATQVAAHLSRCSETGATEEELTRFFGYSLGGQSLVIHVPAALRWLADPARLLAYRDDHDHYRLTTLGLAATRAVLPLTLASGFAQLLKDLLSLDVTDRLLAQWQHLDHLIILELLFGRTPKLRRFRPDLVEQLDAWMNAEPSRSSLLHKEWIAGARGTSGASEVLGSLGVRSASVVGKSEELARKEAYSAILRAMILYELGGGLSADELERRWNLTGLAGMEERWRDEHLWLLAGIAEILDLRCFYFHLREECEADRERIKRVKKLLLRIRAQAFELRERLKYCSPLGPIFRDIHKARTSIEPTIGLKSIRRLEAAGLSNLEDLARLQVDDLIRIGLRRDLADQIRAYFLTNSSYRPGVRQL